MTIPAPLKVRRDGIHPQRDKLPTSPLANGGHPVAFHLSTLRRARKVTMVRPALNQHT